MAKDANALAREYRSLPAYERLRFFLLLNEIEQSFSVPEAKAAKAALNNAGVDAQDPLGFALVVRRAIPGLWR